MTKKQLKLNILMLKQVGACNEGIKWFKRQKERDLIQILHKLLQQDMVGWADWLIEQFLTQQNQILWDRDYLLIYHHPNFYYEHIQHGIKLLGEQYDQTTNN